LKNKKNSLNKFLGTKYWGLLIMGKDGRRSEREPKFLAVNIFSTPKWNDLGKSEKTVREFRKSDSFPVKVHSVETEKRSFGSG
jgi:hypothetical protein